jgi:hypothetical protein
MKGITKMIIFNGKNGNRIKLEQIEADNYHNLFTKLDMLIMSDGTPSYFDRDLMLEFLAKKCKRLTELEDDIDIADEKGDDKQLQALYEKQAELMYTCIDELSEDETLELIYTTGQGINVNIEKI